MSEILDFFIKNLILAWNRNAGHTRAFIGIAGLTLIAGFGFGLYSESNKLDREVQYAAAFVTGIGLLGLLIVAAKEELQKSEKAELEVRQVEEKARANPERPEFAWDLARTKLERYLDRNLYEVRAIFVLTTLVMLGGFGLVVYGLLQSFSQPTNLPVSIVSAASGVLLSFIGGSFLLIYRSVLAQSASYVSILERINAVGMAVQIASTVPDTDGKLKAETVASLAKSLLTMYGTTPGAPQPKDAV